MPVDRGGESQGIINAVRRPFTASLQKKTPAAHGKGRLLVAPCALFMTRSS
jgi:hypothetical protein